ncbi:TPA: relaxase/mobilization nuclease domain-containing protein, partial [Enterococcus faecium]
MGSIIKIASKSRSIHNTISYMLNKQEDSELVTGIGVSNDLNAIEEFKRTNEIFGDKGKIKLWHFTQSFDPLEDISAEKAHELGVKWAEKMFPNQSILVVTHTDKGHVHNHFGISPNDQRTGKKMDIRKNDIRVLQAWNDNILIDNGINPLDMYKYNHLVADRENWKEREFRTENKISNREKIKLAVSEVAQYAKNYDDFHAELKKNHSIETYRFAKNQRIGYKLLDSEDGLILKIGGKRLGQNYDMNYLDDLFTENKKAEQIQSEEVLTEIAIRYLGKSLNGRADSRFNWQERAQRFELDNENIPFLRSSKDYEE